MNFELFTKLFLYSTLYVAVVTTVFFRVRDPVILLAVNEALDFPFGLTNDDFDC